MPHQPLISSASRTQLGLLLWHEPLRLVCTYVQQSFGKSNSIHLDPGVSLIKGLFPHVSVHLIECSGPP